MADLTTESQAAPVTTASVETPSTTAPESQAVATEVKATDTSTPVVASTTEAKPVEGDAAAKEAADKAAADAAAKPVEYEFKLPDGVKFEPAALEEFTAAAKEMGLSQENAQKLADMGAKQALGFTTQMTEQHKATVAEWGTATTNDKEIGGDKLPENLGLAKKALDQFGTPELKKLLNDSGLGNNPEIVRAFVKVGKAISEDGKFVAGTAGQANRSDKPLENRLYPNN